MGLFRLISAAGLAVALIGYALPGIAADEAGSLVARFGDQALQIISNPQIGTTEREQRFHVLVDQYFDIPAIARFVLGRYWRTATEEERIQFTAAFQNHMVHSYVTRLGDYSGEQFKVMPARHDGDNDTIVPASILRPGGQSPLTMEWNIQAGGAGLRIRDVSIAGVSMALTYRDEFGSLLQRNDGKVAVLIAGLRGQAGNN